MIRRLFVLTLALTSCAAPPRVAGAYPTPAQALQNCPVLMTTNALARVSAGLLYLSETDAPFSAVWYPGQRLPRAAEVAAFVMLNAAAVEVREFDAFFERLMMPADPQEPASVQSAQRFRLLHDTFRRSFPTLQVYRVQKRENPAMWHIFILGEGRCGVAGLETWAIET